MAEESKAGGQAGHGEGHGHHEHPPYMPVFFALILLTVVEVFVVYLPIPQAAIISSLVAMSLAKAVLVAMYFMHLAMDNKKLMIVVLSPIVLSAMLFVIPVIEADAKVEKKPTVQFED